MMGESRIRLHRKPASELGPVAHFDYYYYYYYHHHYRRRRHRHRHHHYHHYWFNKKMHAISKVIQNVAKSILTVMCQGTLAPLSIMNYKMINVEVR
jgi:hypothetical protein